MLYCTRAVIKLMNDFFLFDSHMQDISGMLDPISTAAVMNSVQSYYLLYNKNIKRARRRFTVNN
jgi:hypothetical protein